MKGSKIVITIVLANTFLLFGCKSECKRSDRMEGFKNGYLRVYVRLDLNDSTYYGDKIGDINDYMMDYGRKRANNLLECYIRTAIKDRTSIELARRKIPDVLEDMRIACQDCYDKYCEAFIDFNIKALDEIVVE